MILVMTKEEKQLLLIDLCARLPYGVIVHNEEGYEGHLNSINYTIFGIELGVNITATHRVDFQLDTCKPYLRSMSSMTQEEIDEYDAELEKDIDIVINGSLDKDRHITSDGKHTFSKNFVTHFGNDWLNKKGFDSRGLIPIGLALEAPEGMYKTK